MKKILSIMLCTAMILTMSVSALAASQVAPVVGGGSGTMYTNGIVNIGNTKLDSYLATEVADGKLRFGLYKGTAFAADGGYFPNKLEKTLDSQIPNAGKATISVTMNDGNSDSYATGIQLWSGNTCVAYATFKRYEGTNTIETTKLTTAVSNGSTSMGYPHQNKVTLNELVLDYDNGRFYTIAGLETNRLSSKVYYSDEGVKYESAEAAAEAGVTVPGIPFDTTLKIDKISFVPLAYESYKNFMEAKIDDSWIDLYDVKVTSNQADFTAIHDDFEDDTKASFEYGWDVTDSSTPAIDVSHYYRTGNGFGYHMVNRSTSKNNEYIKIDVPLGKTYTSGTVIAEMTWVAKEIATDGTVSAKGPYDSGYTSGTGVNHNYAIGFKNADDTCAAKLEASTSYIWMGKEDGVNWSCYKSFNAPETTFRFVFDLTNGTVMPYFKNGENFQALNGGTAATLTKDGTGAYSIDTISLSNYYYVSSSEQVYGLKDINVYEVSDKTVETPGFFDSSYTEVTTAPVGAALKAFVPVNNTASSQITVIEARFDSQEKFKEAKTHDISTASGYALGEVDITVDADAASGDVIKLFVWDSTSGLYPYVKPISVTIQ